MPDRTDVGRPAASAGSVGVRAPSRHARGVVVFVALAAALLVSLVAAAPALAHAQVNTTFPADGAVLDETPVEVSITFNEGVQVPTAGLRVYDRLGERVDSGDAEVDPQDASRIRTSLAEGLGSGTYVVTWRAVSADGHPIKGAWLYSVGEGGEIGEDLVAALFASGGDRPLAVMAVLTRGVATGGALLAAGVAIFLAVVARGDRRDDEDDRLCRLLAMGALVGGVASLAGIPLQAMLETGLGLAALAPAPMADVVTSPVGLSAVVRGLALLALWRLAAGGGVRTPVLGLALLAALTFAFEGHSLTQDPIALILAADIVHLLAAAAWGGGIVALFLLVRGRRRDDDSIGAARIVAGFSRLATWSLLAVAVAGSAMSWVTVRAARALTTTDYGWTLLAKVSLVGVLMVLGLYNNRRLVPAVVGATRVAGGSEASRGATAAASEDAGVGPGADAAPDPDLARRIADGGWLRLRQTLRLEAIVFALVVAVTGLLVGQQPASQEAGITGAYTTYVDLSEDLEVNLVVDPNRAGLNEIHVYVLDRSGRPFDAEDVRFLLEQPERDLGPFDRLPEIAGPGHWSLVGRELAVAGQWQVTVIVRTGTFTEEQVTIPVVVNR